jgi:hypothetical protein
MSCKNEQVLTSIFIQDRTLHFTVPITSLLNLALLLTSKKKAHIDLRPTSKKGKSTLIDLPSVLPTNTSIIDGKKCSVFVCVFYFIVLQLRIHILGGCIKN